MPTDVVMPQMGESIAEGTIVRWIKKVGDAVERDEPLFEISTDKVDAEIPSPAAGVVTEIRAKEGETVAVNSIVAVIGAAGERPATPSSEVHVPATKEPPPAPASVAPAAPAEPPSASQRPSPSATHEPSKATGAGDAGAVHDESEADVVRQRSSPLVRKIAKEHRRRHLADCTAPASRAG